LRKSTYNKHMVFLMTNISRLPVTPDSSQELVEKVMGFYENFSKESLALLDDIYTQDVEFVDPIHKLEGMLALKTYFRGMLKNMQHYEMHYNEIIVNRDCVHFSWEMNFSHRQLNKGQPITVKGMSLLKFTSKVYYHEDCYDLGALVYEHVPVLGYLTRLLKKRMQN